MGRIIVLISMTPDGFADPENVTIDPEFFEFTESLMAVSDAVIFGSKTFEQFQGRWIERLEDKSAPDWIKKMAQSLHDIKKIVFSSSLASARWNNSRIMARLDTDFIKSFKEDDKGGLLTLGSLSIVESLMELDLVDDYYFNIQPVIAGGGEARFFNANKRGVHRQLRYVDCKQLSSGAHIIHYSTVNNDACRNTNKTN
jgi:dihydrofolate reductase